MNYGRYLKNLNLKYLKNNKCYKSENVGKMRMFITQKNVSSRKL